MRIRVIFFAASLLLLLSGCKTNRDLIYLGSTVDNEFVEGVALNAPVYVIKANDNIFVDVQSLSPEVDALFCPTKGQGMQSGVSQNYGSLSAQYLNGYQVSLTGDVLLPLMGAVHVAGLSVAEAQKIVQLRTLEFVKDATVKVKLLSFKITVLGEVKNPGVYFNYNASLSVLEAISMARGVTDYAHVKKVLVVRPTEGGSRTFRLDLTDKKFMSSQAFFLLPNDVVYVEPDKYKSVKINSTFYSLLLSSVSTLILILNVLK